jgi:predicted nucleic-acid-binding Zn-ribbon protein
MKFENPKLSYFLIVLGIIGSIFVVFMAYTESVNNNKISIKLHSAHKKGCVYGNWIQVENQQYVAHKCRVCGWMELKPIPVVEVK